MVNLNNEIFLIYGRPKIGKSTLAAEFPEPVFLATEPGLKYITRIKDEDKKVIRDWETFCKYNDALAKDKAKYKTIVVDTITNLVKYCNDFVCDREGMSHPSDKPMGKGWNMVTQEFWTEMNKLTQSGRCIVLVAHSKDMEIKTRGKDYNRITINLSGKNRDVVTNLPDHILLIDSDYDSDTGKEERFIRTENSQYWDAGSRNTLLAGAGKIPLSYEELYKYFKQWDELGK